MAVEASVELRSLRKEFVTPAATRVPMS